MNIRIEECSTELHGNLVQLVNFTEILNTIRECQTIWNFSFVPALIETGPGQESGVKLIYSLDYPALILTIQINKTQSKYPCISSLVLSYLGGFGYGIDQYPGPMPMLDHAPYFIGKSRVDPELANITLASPWAGLEQPKYYRTPHIRDQGTLLFQRSNA